MSAISDELRAAVTARAEHRCEYCRLPQQLQVGTFPVDHVTPRSEGGQTVLENLSLACPQCNGHKWAHEDAVDPVSQLRTRLFNPRTDTWTEHFYWNPANPSLIEGATAMGRGTIELLQMNSPNLVEIRRLLAALGLPVT